MEASGKVYRKVTTTQGHSFAVKAYGNEQRARPQRYQIQGATLLLDSNSMLRIADFGLAKIPASEANPETGFRHCGNVRLHCPKYCSTRKVNVESDIYSFVVVLLELALKRSRDSNETSTGTNGHTNTKRGNSVADCPAMKRSRITITLEQQLPFSN
nr:systemin receptor SR160-like [Ipomoea batatas]